MRWRGYGVRRRGRCMVNERYGLWVLKKSLNRTPFHLTSMPPPVFLSGFD